MLPLRGDSPNPKEAILRWERWKGKEHSPKKGALHSLVSTCGETQRVGDDAGGRGIVLEGVGLMPSGVCTASEITRCPLSLTTPLSRPLLPGDCFYLYIDF